MEKMVERLDNITTHPDLNMPEQPSAKTPDPAREASWAEYCSSKFQFLGYFIDTAVEKDIHVIVAAKPGKTVDILENYLLGKGFSKTDSTEPNRELDRFLFRGKLSFTIKRTDGQAISQPRKKPDVIIALDRSFRTDNPSIHYLRTNHSKTDHLTPVVRLIIANTAEHIDRSLPQSSDVSRLQHLIRYTAMFSGSAGDLQDDALGVQEDAEEIVSYLESRTEERRWTLPTMEAVDIGISYQSPPNTEPGRISLPSGQKRFLVGLIRSVVWFHEELTCRFSGK